MKNEKIVDVGKALERGWLSNGSIMDKTVELSDRRTFVLGLACACPFGEQLSGCCMGKLREKPLKERVSLARNMSEEELDMIIAQHKTCLAEREHR
jgi:hypothetical protein